MMMHPPPSPPPSIPPQLLLLGNNAFMSALIGREMIRKADFGFFVRIIDGKIFNLVKE
ncbi:hypothetical protein KFK09_023751 [Dendrobium nobile]|uniref:Uncharacterized protein n=1 Tax=Dendrobium nobile TaxID=94219 RepID=A0A8T3ABT8_DENNO|nr:hypothetical protein KFK09_023751 [Dendrobium nobile]